MKVSCTGILVEDNELPSSHDEQVKSNFLPVDDLMYGLSNSSATSDTKDRRCRQTYFSQNEQMQSRMLSQLTKRIAEGATYVTSGKLVAVCVTLRNA